MVVSNAFGSVTSAPAELTIEAPLSPVIVLQPFGDDIALGNYHVLSVAAGGTPPLFYQWQRDGQELAGETNRFLVFPAVQESDAGSRSFVERREARFVGR